MYTHNENYLEETLRTAMIKRQSPRDCCADEGQTNLFTLEDTTVTSADANENE